MNGGAALALLAITCGAGMANAADPDRVAAKRERYVSRGWNIIATPSADRPMTLSQGDVVLKQAVRAARVVRLLGDVTDAKSGKTLLPTGASLFVLESRSGTVACDSTKTRKSRFDSRVCVMDADDSGTFETAANYLGSNGALPVVAGYWPNRPRALTQNVGYEGRPAATEDDLGYFVALRYRSVDVFGKIGFEVLCGRGERRPDVVDTVEVEKSWLPTTLSYLGAEIDLVSLSGQVLDVRVRKPLAPGPLDIVPRDSAFGGTG